MLRAMTGGTEWVIDAFGCDPERLRDLRRLSDLGHQVIRKLDLRVVGSPLLHKFGGAGGVTGLFLLSESHLAWHTYPESRLATVNLYCCREHVELSWEPLLQRCIGASRVSVRRLERGFAQAAAGSAAVACER